MFNKYKGMLKEDKIEQRGDVYVVQDLFNGKVYLSCKTGYLVGVMNAGDEVVALEYLGKALGRIEDVTSGLNQ